MDIASLIIGILTLLVAIAALIVAICAYKYSRKSNKQRIREEIACKKAKLDVIDRMPPFGVSYEVIREHEMERRELYAEIEQLKKML